MPSKERISSLFKTGCWSSLDFGLVLVLELTLSAPQCSGVGTPTGPIPSVPLGIQVAYCRSWTSQPSQLHKPIHRANLFLYLILVSLFWRSQTNTNGYLNYCFRIIFNNKNNKQKGTN